MTTYHLLGTDRDREGAEVIKLELWIAGIHHNLTDCLPNSVTKLALNNHYAVFAETCGDLDKPNLSKARKILEGSEKKFGSLKTQLKSVSTGAYIGIRTGTERLILARSEADVRLVVQLSHTLETAEEDEWVTLPHERGKLTVDG
ncbi:hypothetical protein ISF_09744 [Cordyceps fumosorosea ARSEF 2679]|uniref:Uncharacterized protein n=1 Tax=Cordyceps fumosorosea (strain ARSEF 2679) TaxID=1081104 RepID=A0A167D7V0_CORFA|nr:hypothetical protein ISF_09744 [Cordyceps fumosorosea ARSEF 2679]OAA42049.1 hypothetical protein ISF_09744 [Cordyceps fumosorosea ARSEF 2679]